MTDLRTAAQQALEALEQSAPCHNPLGTVRQDVDRAITALRAALAEPVQQGCDHCNQPLYAAIKCRVCGRVTEPVQEPVAWLTPGQDLHLNNGEGFRFSDWTPLYAAPHQRQAEPVQEPVAWKLWDEDPQGGGDWRYYDAKDFKNGINPTEYFDGLVPLYTAPPQRKPLTEKKIKKLLIESAGMTIQFSDVDLRLARAIERAHGITP